MIKNSYMIKKEDNSQVHLVSFPELTGQTEEIYLYYVKRQSHCQLLWSNYVLVFIVC